MIADSHHYYEGSSTTRLGEISFNDNEFIKSTKSLLSDH